MYIKSIAEQYYRAFVAIRILRGIALASLIMPLYFLIAKNTFFQSMDTSVAGLDITTIAFVVNSIVFLLIFTAYVRIVSGGYLAAKIIKVLAFIYIIILIAGIGSALLSMGAQQELEDSGLTTVLNNMLAASLIQALFVFAGLVMLVTGMVAHLSFKDTEYDIIYRNKELSAIRYGISHFFNQPSIDFFRPIALIQFVLILGSLFFEGMAYFIIIQASEIVRGIHYWVESVNELHFVPFLLIGLLLVFIVFQFFLLISLLITGVLKRVTLKNAKKAPVNAHFSKQSILILKSFGNKQDMLPSVRRPLFFKLFDPLSSFINFDDVIYRALSFLGPIVTLMDPDQEAENLSSPDAVQDVTINEQWQQNTREMMERSRMIVLLAHNTNIITWALKQILSNGKLLAKTLFVFPPGYTGSKDEFLNNLPDSIREEINENGKQGTDTIGFRIVDSKPVTLTTSQPQVDMEYYFSLRFLASQS